MNYIDFIGYGGIFFTILSFLPVVLSVARTKKTVDFPYRTIILAYLGNGLIFLNGFLDKNNVNILLGSTLSLIYTYILYVKVTHKKK